MKQLQNWSLEKISDTQFAVQQENHGPVIVNTDSVDDMERLLANLCDALVADNVFQLNRIAGNMALELVEVSEALGGHPSDDIVALAKESRA